MVRVERTWGQFLRLGTLALAVVMVLAACDLSSSDPGQSDGEGSVASDLGLLWNGDRFQLTGTVSEMDQEPAALTVTYPTEEGTDETVLVILPDGVLTPVLNVGDLVVIRGERDASGALMAQEIEQVAQEG